MWEWAKDKLTGSLSSATVTGEGEGKKAKQSILLYRKIRKKLLYTAKEKSLLWQANRINKKMIAFAGKLLIPDIVRVKSN